MTPIHNRRSFLAGLSASSAAAAFARSGALAEEVLETTTVRFADFPGSICTVPQYIAEQFLREDGFTEIIQVSTGDNTTTAPQLEANELDFGLDFATGLALNVDQGKPIVALAGVHVGCWILFAREGINSILDLKGRSVGTGRFLGSDPHIFVSAMATYVGLDPRTEIDWVVSDVSAVQLFEEGKIDALVSFPPEAQELRARGLGHVVVNSMLDRPWSQYFCCMLLARPEYAWRYPVATKRVVRAILKASEVCISDPQLAVRKLVERGYVKDEQRGYALEALTEIPYHAWREYDPEDTMRFFALRLHEAGMIESSPQKIIADGSDWRILNELKRELKG